MALFTDGLVSQLEDLAAQDSQLLATASLEGIDVTQKLKLSQDDLGLELESLLQTSERVEGGSWFKSRSRIGNIVSTPALKQWHTFHALELVYTDAYSSQLSERYALKRDHFAERGRQACEKLRLLGLGLVSTPICRAAQPQVLTAQGNLADGTYYVAVAWTNGKGEEGTASPATAIATVQSTFLVQAGPAPENAAGWNVYAGSDPQVVLLQNDSPIGKEQTWVQPDVLQTAGRGPGYGQRPDYMLPIPRRIFRG